VGYFGYDLGRALERVPSLAADDSGVPPLRLAVYRRALRIDPGTGEAEAIERTDLPVGGEPEDAARFFEALIERAGSTRPERRGPGATPAAGRPRPERPESTGPGGTFLPDPPGPAPGEAAGLERRLGARASLDREAYLRGVERIREYIAAGDVYQVNLARRVSVPYAGDPMDLFLRLDRGNPAPFAAYLGFEGGEVVSASPECFLSFDPESRIAATEPIKGTRPRGRDPVEDAALRAELLASAKDHAEHLMILDLERNDLGRVSEHGSVRVREGFRIEAHPTVWHLVSTVEGRVRPDRDALHLLAAAFPGGSITGAPKIRAMEIIEELEPVRRGVYTGGIGALSFSGALALNIAIRTIVLSGGRASLHVGGGIVHDSSPEAEFHETEDKGLALLRALAEEGRPGRAAGAG
jgi:para-aminobenzoate synthetase component 1